MVIEQWEYIGNTFDMYVTVYTISGWWFQPLWKKKVSWDDYSQDMEKSQMFETTNQIYAG